MSSVALGVGGSAILGASVLGAGATIYAGNKASSATTNAANTAAATQQNALNQQIQETAPFRQAGVDALGQLEALLGITPSAGQQQQGTLGSLGGQGPRGQGPVLGMNGTSPIFGLQKPGGTGAAPQPTQASALQTLQNTPGYQFTRDQGLMAGQNAATTAGGVSGNTLEALTKYASGLAETTYQGQVTNLQNLVNTGEGAATNTAANIGNAANNLSNIAMTQGTNQANIGMAQAGQITGTLNNALNQYTLSSVLSGINGGGG